MTTVNISLTDEQAQFVDACVTAYGFANRSEFFRTMIRKISADNKLIHPVSTHPFVNDGVDPRDEALLLFDKGKGEYLAGKLKKITSLSELT